MQAPLDAASIQVALAGARRLTEAQRRADVSFVRLNVADIESMMESGRIDMGKSGSSNENGLLAAVKFDSVQVLPRLSDCELSGKATVSLEKVMEYVKEERLHNIRQTPDRG